MAFLSTRARRSGVFIALIILLFHTAPLFGEPRRIVSLSPAATEILFALGQEDRIVGVMIESHLVEGRQNLVPEKPLEYGQSITDACIGWEDSIAVLELLAQGVRARRLIKASQ